MKAFRGIGGSTPSIFNPLGFEILTAVSTKMAVFWVVAIALMMEAATKRKVSA
jgi:hypothetical protein